MADLIRTSTDTASAVDSSLVAVVSRLSGTALWRPSANRVTVTFGYAARTAYSRPPYDAQILVTLLNGAGGELNSTVVYAQHVRDDHTWQVTFSTPIGYDPKTVRLTVNGVLRVGTVTLPVVTDQNAAP